MAKNDSPINFFGRFVEDFPGKRLTEEVFEKVARYRIVDGQRVFGPVRASMPTKSLV